MSLINEALKKAQRQRTDAAVPAELPSTPAAPGQPVPRIAKRRPPMPARTLVLLLVGGGLVLVTGGILTFVLLTIDTKPPVIAHAAPVVHPTPLAPPTVTTPPAAPPAVVIPQAPAPAAPVKVAVAPAPMETPTPIVTLPPAPTPVAPPRPVVAPPKPVANPAINTLLDALRISGVRLSGADSKVIMNDRIVRLNDIVDRSTGLRLTKITATSLGFTDSAGFEYTKDL